MRATWTPLFLLASMLAAGCATEVTSIRDAQQAVLDEREGFLLLEVATTHNLESITLSGPKSIKLTSADLRSGSNYILTNLPAGDYEIERVDLNDFYYYNMRGDVWGFTVEEGVISYVGNLTFSGRQWGQRGDFVLVNRSSFALEYLEDNFSTLLESHDLVYRGPGGDRFFPWVLGK